MIPVTAIIPTLTNTTGLKKIVVELQNATVPVIIIDNNPTSDKELLQSVSIKYLPQTINLGFAPAINLGIKQATNKWILIANDDIEGITKEKISHLIYTAQRNDWTAVSPILKSPKGTIENIGYRVLPIGRVELNFDPNKNSDKDIDGLTAACLLIRRDVYIEIGMFDESFVAYLEDVDLFLRLKKADCHFGIDTSISVTHNHMTTSSKMKGFKEKRDCMNWWRIMLKNYTFSHWSTYIIGLIVERLRNLSGYIKSLK